MNPPILKMMDQLLPCQRRWLRTQPCFTIGLCARQTGKDYTAALILYALDVLAIREVLLNPVPIGGEVVLDALDFLLGEGEFGSPRHEVIGSVVPNGSNAREGVQPDGAHAPCADEAAEGSDGICETRVTRWREGLIMMSENAGGGKMEPGNPTDDTLRSVWHERHCNRQARQSQSRVIQTGWVKAPLAATSQTSKRTHLRPSRLAVVLRVRAPNSRVSVRSIFWRWTRWPSPETISA